MSSLTDGLNPVKCKWGASLLNNNLSGNGDWLAYIHKGEIHLIKNSSSLLTNSLSISSTQSIRSGYQEKDPVNQTSMSIVEGRAAMLVITSGGLLQVFDETGQKLVAYHRLGRLAETKGMSRQAIHLKGVVANGHHKIWVGTGTGPILPFRLDGSALDVDLETKLEGHTEAIGDLGIDLLSGVLASGDDSGKVIMWDYKRHAKIAEFKGNKYPVTSIKVGHGHVVAAYLSGHIRIFSIEAKELVCEIAAHTRSITAIDLHPNLPMVVAASEDTHISIWTLPTANDPQGVQSVLTRPVDHGLLTGVKFSGETFGYVSVMTHDSRFMLVAPVPSVEF